MAFGDAEWTLGLVGRQQRPAAQELAAMFALGLIALGVRAIMKGRAARR
jgi:hypothetical protein